MALNKAILIGPDRNGRCVAVENGLVAALPPKNARVLSCAGGEIRAGAVCAHTHLYSGLSRYGMPAASPPPGNFLQLLERVWWRLDRALDETTLRAAAMDYVARALLAGTTALVDHHESPNLIEGSLAILAEVCEQLGMRALLCYGATERNAGRDEARRGLAECRRAPPSRIGWIAREFYRFERHCARLRRACARTRHGTARACRRRQRRRGGRAVPRVRWSPGAPFQTRSARARFDSGTRRPLESRAGGNGGLAFVLAGAESSLKRSQPRRLCKLPAVRKQGGVGQRRLERRHGGGTGCAVSTRRTV